MGRFLRLVLFVQLIGGGFFGALMSRSFAQSTAPVALREAAMVVLLFAGIAGAGLALAVNTERRWPLIAALAALAVQLPWITSPTFSYKLGAGLSFWFITLPDQGPAWMNLGVDSALGLPDPRPWGVGINVVALALLVLVWRSRSRVGA